MNHRRALLLGSAFVAVAFVAVAPRDARGQGFVPGDLVVSSSTYAGGASTVTIGQVLPGGGNAVANGTYPQVFNNASVDGSFGVTSPLFLNQFAVGGTAAVPVLAPQGTINVTALTGVATSFASKSEGALNLSPDRRSLTLVDYSAPINALDISNSNTPGIIEPGNPVTTTPTARTIVNFNASGQATAVLPTNAYPGNNGRAAINLGGTFILTGNAGNGNGSPAVTAASGVQMLNPATATTTAGAYNTTMDGSFSLANTSYGGAGDKAAKDNNYRGLTDFNGTIYVSKGSGSNGVDTVYQVGLSSNGNTISPLPGFPTAPARNPGSNYYPFGLFFANATTLYVADEGAGTNKASVSAGALTAADLATAAGDPLTGLGKYSLVNGTWQLDYTLQGGLGLGIPYTVTGTDLAGDSGSYAAATDGLRNITGEVNADGSVTLFAVTSTISAGGDEGADPNRLVAINDLLGATTLPVSEQFATLATAQYGQVLRGVSFAPVPEPASLAVLGAGLAGLIAVRRKRRG